MLLTTLSLSSCQNKNSLEHVFIPHNTSPAKNYDESPSHPKYHGYSEIGTASWYGGRDGLHGKRTASGMRFDKNAMTAAHKTLPLLSIVKVTNLENNRSVVVTINDRGPFSKKRVLDLSAKAAEVLSMKNQGSAQVKIEYLSNTENNIAKPVNNIKVANSNKNQSKKLKKTSFKNTRLAQKNPPHSTKM